MYLEKVTMVSCPSGSNHAWVWCCQLSIIGILRKSRNHQPWNIAKQKNRPSYLHQKMGHINWAQVSIDDGSEDVAGCGQWSLRQRPTQLRRQCAWPARLQGGSRISELVPSWFWGWRHQCVGMLKCFGFLWLSPNVFFLQISGFALTFAKLIRI